MSNKLYRKKSSYDISKKASKESSYRASQYTRRMIKGPKQTQNRKGIKSRDKKSGTVLRDNSNKGIIRQSYVDNVLLSKKNTSQQVNDFISLFKANLNSIEEAFKDKDSLQFTVTLEKNLKKFELTITQNNLLHLLGFNRGLFYNRANGDEKEKGSIMMYAAQIPSWFSLNVIQRLRSFLDNYHFFSEYENNNGSLLNYTRIHEKNKNFFLFDFFNNEKESVYCKYETQEEFDKLFDKQFNGPKNKQDCYIHLERVYYLDKQKRYISLIFKEFIEQQENNKVYKPITIIETPQRLLSENDKAILIPNDLICTLSSLIPMILSTVPTSTIRDARNIQSINKGGRNGK